MSIMLQLDKILGPVPVGYEWIRYITASVLLLLIIFVVIRLIFTIFGIIRK